MNESLSAPIRPAAPIPLLGKAARIMATIAVIIALGTTAFGIRYAIVTGDATTLLSHQSFTPVLAMMFAGIGSLILARHGRSPIGWFFLITSLCFALTSLSATILLYPTFSTVVTATASWLNRWIWLPAIFLPTLFVLFLFPNGRLLTPQWRFPFWLAGVGLLLLIIALAFHPSPLPEWGVGANSFGIRGTADLMDGLMNVSGWFLLVGFISAIFAFILRFRRSDTIERKQLQWLLYAIVLVTVVSFFSIPLWILLPTNAFVQEATIMLTNVTVLGIASITTIAILRYRLYDIDIVINRTLLYSALTLSIVAIYVLVVGGLGTLFHAEGNPLISLGATGVVAVVVQPLTNRLQRGVNRFFYGERDDPLSALAQLGQRLEAAIAPEILLPTLVDTIAQTLKLPYVAIRLRSGEEYKIAAQSGTETTDVIRLPIIYQGDTVGMLMAGVRSPGEAFSRADQHLLKQIAHQAGPTAYNVQLTEDLRQSRMRLVTAREEERRRLRRDLHDGLGPVLASQGLKLAAISQLLTSKPTQAQQLLAELTTQNERTVAEIRRLVYHLRPAALDELGLVGAVRDYASDLKGRTDGAPRLSVEVQAPDTPLPFMTAAIEAAAYRIVTEALTNVVRHARARRAVVVFDLCEMHLRPTLRLEIKDDGIGMADNRRAGVGLISMRERAEEIGGNFKISSTPGKGTHLVALLPLTEHL
jgi:signal transduction histidine kinase